jgi:hypothetical protein
MSLPKSGAQLQRSSWHIGNSRVQAVSQGSCQDYGVTRTLKFPDNSGALAAFIADKIDTILASIAALSAEHFNRAPDDVTWADGGILSGYVRSAAALSMRANTRPDC